MNSKIVLLNSYYSRRNPSGENEIFDQLTKQLRTSNPEVNVISTETDVMSKSALFRVKSAIREITGFGSSQIARKLKESKISIIHVNNLFPNISRKAILRADKPKIITLHNYRAICVAGTFSREGKFCNLCCKSPINSIRYKCYRNSFLATIPLFISRIFKLQLRFIKKMDCVVVPSNMALRIFENFGIVDKRWRVIPHLAPQFSSRSHEISKTFVFVGRLSREKGIEKLLANWPSILNLDVIGDGEINVHTLNLPRNVTLLGRLTRDELLIKLSNYQGLIFTSNAPESAVPLVVLEALTAGLPIISVEGNAVSDANSIGNFGVTISKNYDSKEILDAARNVTKYNLRFSENGLKYINKYHSQEVWMRNYKEAYSATIFHWNDSKKL